MWFCVLQKKVSGFNLTYMWMSWKWGNVTEWDCTDASGTSVGRESGLKKSSCHPQSGVFHQTVFINKHLGCQRQLLLKGAEDQGTEYKMKSD